MMLLLPRLRAMSPSSAVAPATTHIRICRCVCLDDIRTLHAFLYFARKCSQMCIYYLAPPTCCSSRGCAPCRQARPSRQLQHIYAYAGVCVLMTYVYLIFVVILQEKSFKCLLYSQRTVVSQRLKRAFMQAMCARQNTTQVIYRIRPG